MKYFSPSYWFKLWVLSVPLFNDKTQGINAISIDNNEKIKDWTSKNTSLEMINQKMSYTNLSNNYQPYNLNQQPTNQNINPIYQTELETSTHKHRHEKNRNRIKKSLNEKTPELIFDLNKKNNIKKNTDLIINHLSENGIINRITTRNVEEVYEINRNLEGNTSRYFLIPIRTENNENVWKLELLFTAHDLYLNGFILRNGNVIHYFHFNGAGIQNINNANNHVLGFGGDYGDLNRADGTGRAPQQNINRDSIIQSIDYLNDFITNNVFNLNNNRFLNNNRQTRQSLRNIILLISESIRFNNVANDLNNLYNGEVNNYNWNHFEDTILNWRVRSRNALLPSITAQRLANDVRILNLETAIERHNIQEISRRSNFYPTNCTPNWMARQKKQINNNFICSNEFYYDNNKNSKTFTLKYDNTYNRIITLNLGKNNPLNFDKISVLNEEYPYVKASWGNTPYFGIKFSEFLKEKKISDLLINEKITENNKKEFFNNHNFYKLQEEKNKVFLGSMAAIQSIYPTFYWENNNYYLQFLIHQYGESWESSGGELWMNIGNGIKFDKYINNIIYDDNLYNILNTYHNEYLYAAANDLAYDNTRRRIFTWSHQSPIGQSGIWKLIRTDNNKYKIQISNPNDRKKRNIIFKTTKWTNEITKNINHEQHLSITSNTNYVTNNINSTL